jgi:hypothetical protein
VSPIKCPHVYFNSNDHEDFDLEACSTIQKHKKSELGV